MAAEPSKAVIFLVALDASDAAERVLEVGCGFAAALGDRAELHVIHVAGHGAPVSPMALPVFVSPAGLAEAGERLIDHASSRAARDFRGKIVGHVATGDAWREITAAAARLGADLIVVGTAGRSGVARLALGSVAEQVIRHAGCSVLVVRPKEHDVPRT